MEIDNPLAIVRGGIVNDYTEALEKGFRSFYFSGTQKYDLREFIEGITLSADRESIQIILESNTVETPLNLLPENVVYADRYIINNFSGHGDKRNFCSQILHKIPALFKKTLIKSYGVRNFNLEVLEFLVRMAIASQLPLPQAVVVEDVPKKDYIDFCHKHNIMIYVWSLNTTAAAEDVARQNETDSDSMTASILFQNGIGLVTDNLDIQYRIFNTDPSLEFIRPMNYKELMNSPLRVGSISTSSSLKSVKDKNFTGDLICSAGVCYKSTPSKKSLEVIRAERL